MSDKLREAAQPEQRKPLTDDEWYAIWLEVHSDSDYWKYETIKRYTRAVERAHGIYNN